MNEFVESKEAGEDVKTTAIESNDSTGTSIDGVDTSIINSTIPAKYYGTSVDNHEMKSLGRHQELNVSSFMY
jgi:hypothetical protein